MNQTTLQDDLAYVRDLAEAGQTAPLLGGRFLTFWGGLTSIAYFLHYAISADLFGWPHAAFSWVWGTFIIIGLIGQAVLGRTLRNKPGGNSVGNRTEGTVWMAGGFALFAFFGALILKSLVTGVAVPGFEASLPIVFAIYATGLLTSGLMGGTRVLTYAGYVALGIVALASWFDGTVEIWAVASLGAFLTVFLPGLILMRAEPKSII
ncbi:MAG: hypothetical protein AAGL11_11445 [Pseudomonadota bacterium]